MAWHIACEIYIYIYIWSCIWNWWKIYKYWIGSSSECRLIYLISVALLTERAEQEIPSAKNLTLYVWHRERGGSVDEWSILTPEKYLGHKQLPSFIDKFQKKKKKKKNIYIYIYIWVFILIYRFLIYTHNKVGIM